MINTELTKIREAKKLSKKEFAELLGISPMMLGKYEKGSCAIPESIAEKLAAASDAVTGLEIGVKKDVRKGARTIKEIAEQAVNEGKEAAAGSDAAVATEIEVRKNARKAVRTVKKAVEGAADLAKESAMKAAGIPNIVIQSSMGGYISAEEIGKRVPKNTTDVYVRVDENKLYYVLDNGETGDVDIWE